MVMGRSRFVAALTVLGAVFGASSLAAAESATAVAPLQPEQATTEKLGAPKPHWFLVYDTNFLGYLDSKVYLYDGDTGAMLGMLSTGAFGNAVELAPDFSAIYVPEIYYSRGTRGDRTDVVTIYDTKELKAQGEVVIPPKRATGVPHRAYQGLSDDGQFMYVANMTPATSVSVVDVKARKFVAEIEMSGCNLVYPIGNRAFASLCGDGTVQVVSLDDQGNLKGRERSEKFFDPDKDPVTEKASRFGNTWFYVSFDGYVHPVAFDGGKAKPGKAWSLFTDKERADGWRVGGGQFNAVHEKLGRLFVIVHQGGPYGHKDPGKNVWTYDLATSKKLGSISMVAPVTSLGLTKDTAPLLIADDAATPAVYVYDALKGTHLRTIEGPPMVPGFIQAP
jgi:methylamine dehydrogenase heavy chain